MITLLNKEFELQQRYALHYEPREIDEWFVENASYLWNYIEDYSKEVYNPTTLMNYVGWEFETKIERAEGILQGSIPKRVSQYLAAIDRPMSDYDYRKFAELVGDYTPHNLKNLEIDIVNHIDWMAGDYGEERGSCWWGMYIDGRINFEYTMAQGRAGAIRFYRDGKPFGRCFFIIESADSIVTFNYYGRGLGHNDAMLALADLFGCKLNRRVGLRLGSGIYVNSGSGCRLSSAVDDRTVDYSPWSDYKRDDYDLERRIALQRVGGNEKAIFDCQCCHMPRYRDQSYIVAPYTGWVCISCMRSDTLRTSYFGAYWMFDNGWTPADIFFRDDYYERQETVVNHRVRVVGVERMGITPEQSSEIMLFKQWMEEGKYRG